MSYSVSNLFQSLGLNNANPGQQSETTLFNPDLPMPSKDFQKIKNIRDRSFQSMKLPPNNKSSYNGSTFRLPRNVQFKDPRKENFSMDSAIDPNNIRSLQNPTKSIPDLWSNPNRYFGISTGETTANNNVNTVRSARRNYISYKNRFEMPDPYLLKPTPLQLPVK